MTLKHDLRRLEKNHLRPFIKRFKGMFSAAGGVPVVPAHLLLRLEALETRVAELEQLVQEDIGLRLSGLHSHKPDGTDGS